MAEYSDVLSGRKNKLHTPKSERVGYLPVLQKSEQCDTVCFKAYKLYPFCAFLEATDRPMFLKRT